MGILLSALALALTLPPGQEADRLGFLDNGQIRLGVNLNLGGAITYLSKSGSDENVVNSSDWGRQIQMSHYSGPVPFTPNGKQPKPSWAGLGWNPIQCGDAYGNRSKLLVYRNDGSSIYVKCVPMQWPLNNEPGECTFECWIHLEGKTAKVRSRLVNARSDKTQYEGRDQELPAIYTNGPWWRLMTYTGDKPFTGDKLSQRPSVFPWTSWQATENWAALVNDQNFGLGVWHPGLNTFLGGFAGPPGAGGPKDSPTGYIAPLHREVIDANIDYDYRYTLILGNLDEIRKYVYDHAQRPKPPVYRFAKDREHWIYRGAVDSGWPVRGEIAVQVGAPNAMLVGPDTFWMAKDAPRLTLEAAFDPGDTTAAVYWKRFDVPSFNDAKKATFPVIADGKFHRYVVDLRALPEYKGAITGLQLGLGNASSPGQHVRIRLISLR